jgi:DHA2 family multidrug resistance protein
MFTGINLEIAQSNIIYPMIISGFAMGFVFVPLTTISVATLPVEQIGNASGIFNLMRNTGGSIGIAVMTTLLARNQQIHQAVLTAHTTDYDQPFQQMFEQIRNGLLATMDAATATEVAYRQVYGMVVRQAAVLSYIDDFWLLTILCGLCVPAGFFFKRVLRPRKVEGMH